MSSYFNCKGACLEVLPSQAVCVQTIFSVEHEELLYSLLRELSTPFFSFFPGSTPLNQATRLFFYRILYIYYFIPYYIWILGYFKIRWKLVGIGGNWWNIRVLAASYVLTI